MNLIYVLLVLAVVSPAHAKGFKRIPQPTITKISQSTTSPESIIELEGQGFIKGLPSVHKVLLIKGRERIKAKVMQANADLLKIEIPANSNYGDYQLYVKIKTKLLRSKKTKANDLLALRPKAPDKPQLKYQTIKNHNEFDYIIDVDPSLYYELTDEIKIGENQIKAHYYENGFKSIESTSSSFFYLPELAMEKQLELKSETPIESFAVSSFLNTKYNVSSATSHQQNELSRHYYLKTPSQERYLEYTIELSPLFIDQLHVTEPEYLILKNRSSTDFDLANCSLSDSVRERYQFDNQSIKAQSELKIEANLGLNNTSPDHLELKCNDQSLDKFSYEDIDVGGFAVKS